MAMSMSGRRLGKTDFHALDMDISKFYNIDKIGYENITELPNSIFSNEGLIHSEDFHYYVKGLNNTLPQTASIALALTRRLYIQKFGYTLLSEEFVFWFTAHFEQRKILEVCAGTGYFSRAIRERGANAIATDIAPKGKDVVQMDAVEAIRKFDTDLVVMSWPDYKTPIASQVLATCIEKGVDLIYIGEGIGGCCADDDFFDGIRSFKTMMNMLEVPNNMKGRGVKGLYDFYAIQAQVMPLLNQHFLSWPSIHDQVYYIPCSLSKYKKEDTK